MRILTYSDLHGRLPQIPKAHRNDETVIVLCGDTCDNYPTQTFTPGIKQGTVFTPTSWNGVWNFRKIDRVQEATLQKQWVKDILIPHFIQNNINLDRVVWVNGNHDFCDVTDLFPNSTYIDPKVITIDGIKFGLLVGVTSLMGEWFEETTELMFEKRINQIDRDIDILVSHSPCWGIKDKTLDGQRFGSHEIYNSIFGHIGKTPYFHNVKFHLSGHIHDLPGMEKHTIYIEDREPRIVKFYNCARSRFLIKF